ncbi:hypothetical protein DM02DRAFT_615370 [Periconia macrospinosa]|uniref:Uncharacterized protein n=1 Tax=Periconia macrospinosa TaxID=97972 RepID=A0A2V1DPA6_9PLEO|nr:hypothetical protein DM02DRAFT_615370 [Periconia macrospinosa]
MTPSPRNTTAPGFEHSWSEADASFLDPTALPIAKVPRAWERKQETKTTVGGKQKKVWRRYTTRSRATNVAPVDDDHDDDHDSRFRPVKKLQRMSPQAIEKSSKMKGLKKSAFKTTRWDRRKSVLPRKKTARTEPAEDDIENANSSSDECQAGEDADISNNSFSEMDASADLTFEPTTVPENEDRRSTFTFSVQDNQERTVVDDTAPLEKPEKPEAEKEAEQEATLVNFFRSPVKSAPLSNLHHSLEDVAYPELPQSVDMEIDATEVPEDAPLVTESQEEENVDGALTDADIPADHSPEGDSAEQPMSKPELMDMPKEQEITESLAEIPEVSYPSLPAEVSNQEQMDVEDLSEQEDEDESESEMASISAQDEEGLATQVTKTPREEEEEFTEASLQLHIQRDMATEQPDQPSAPTPITHDHLEPISVPEEKMEIDVSVELTQEESENDISDSSAKPTIVNDIADGLTLGPTITPSREHTPRKLRSPSPPPIEHGPEDTMTMALDDDTAMLKDFLSRAAASKANKAATISRRESLQNRRDSDVVRHALASPRKVLEDKDPNSPSKYDNEATLDLSQTLTLSMDQPPLSPTEEQVNTETIDDTVTKASRRSSRTRKSRLPAPASALPVGPSKIAVRRADGGEPVVLKKSDAQELSQLTRANTRKNKQGAFAVSIRLLKLSKDASRRASDDDTAESLANVVPVPGKKYVRWDEQLAYYQEGTDTIANMLAEAESLATPDELSLPDPAMTKAKPKTPKVAPREKKSASTGTSTPKVRRVRGLGASNGTPGKGLLTPASLLPDAVQEEKEQQATTDDTNTSQRLPKPKIKTKPKSTSKAKKMPVADTTPAPPPEQPLTKLPTLEIAPVGIESAKSAAATRKSRLASPKKVKLPQPPSSSSATSDGKENHAQQRGIVGIAGATPKKGIPVLMGIPAGMGVVGGAGNGGADSGLPRRRLRRL